ncbi:hypothetical protein KEM54_001519, partial [Ascosphaera aggregata]
MSAADVTTTDDATAVTTTTTAAATAAAAATVAASSAADPAVLTAALCQYTMGLENLNTDAAGPASGPVAVAGAGSADMNADVDAEDINPSPMPEGGDALGIDPTTNYAPMYSDFFSMVHSPISKAVQQSGLFFNHYDEEGPAPRLVGFSGNMTINSRSCTNNDGSTEGEGVLGGGGGSTSLDENNSNNNSTPVAGTEPRIQAFAKLEFDDGHFYVNTHSLILGRDVRAARAAVQRELRAKQQARASRVHSHRASIANGFGGDPLRTPLRGMSIKPETNPDNFMGGSVVSDKGGIMGYDPDVPQHVPPLVSWKSSNSSAKNESARPMLHMSTAEFPNLQPFDFEGAAAAAAVDGGNDESFPKDYNALAMQSLHGNDAKPVDTLSLLPSPDACPTIPIHPPASANGTVSSHRGISRKHVKIGYNFDRNVFEMEVIGRNGAFIGPDWLAPGQVRPLHSGDYIQIGGVRVRFVLPDEPVGDVGGLDEEPMMGTALKPAGDVSMEGESDVDAVTAPVSKDNKKKKKDKDASPERVRAEAKSPGTSPEKNKKKKKKIKLKVNIPPSFGLGKSAKEKSEKPEKTVERAEKEKEKEKNKVVVQEREVQKPSEEEQPVAEKIVDKPQKPGVTEPQVQEKPKDEIDMIEREQERESDELMMVVQDFKELEEAAKNEPRPSVESPPPSTTIIADGAIIQSTIPAKRRGPGRPPKDGIMSKRERAELAREQKLAAKREANGGVTPSPSSRGKSGKTTATTTTTMTTTSTAPLPTPAPITAAATAAATTIPMTTTIKETSAPPPPTTIAPSMMATFDPDLTPVTKQEKRKYTKRKKLDTLPGENTVFMSVENSNDPRLGQFGQLETSTGVMMTPQAPVQKMLPPPLKKRKPSRSPSPNYPPENLYSAEDLVKPPYNYAVLIFDALSESQTPMTLKQIYRALKLKYPYFRFRCETEGWTSSVRHNLNGNSHLFEHAERDGKGWSWKLIPGASVDKEKKRRPSPPPSTSNIPPQASMPPVAQLPQVAGPSVVAGPYGAQPAAQTFSAANVAAAAASKSLDQRPTQPFQFPPPLTTTQFAAPQHQTTVTTTQPQQQPQPQIQQPQSQTTPSFLPSAPTAPPPPPPAAAAPPTSSFPIPAALRGSFPPSFATNSTSTYQSPYASAPPPEVLQAQAQLRKASEVGRLGTQPPPHLPQSIQQPVPQPQPQLNRTPQSLKQPQQIPQIPQPRPVSVAPSAMSAPQATTPSFSTASSMATGSVPSPAVSVQVPHTVPHTVPATATSAAPPSSAPASTVATPAQIPRTTFPQPQATQLPQQ